MGWGRIGQHRGSGSRGGFGAAGMHKHMWTWVVKYAPTWFGKHGFNKPLKYEVKASQINVGELAELIDKLTAEGKLAEENGKIIVVNLAEMGYYKLLGRGKINKAVKVIVPEATELAVKKIEEAGGEVVLLTKQE